MSSPPPKASPALLPALGLFTTTALVVGGVIGSGIFRKPGVMAAQVGSPEVLLLVWLLAGVITLCGALTNAEIAGMIPETGGQYVFYEKMYGPFAAYLYGWAVFAVIQTGSIAALAYVFSEYTTHFIALPEAAPGLAAWTMHVPLVGDIVPFRELGVKGLAVGLIAGLTMVNYIGVRYGGAVQNIFTVAKVGAMLALVLGVMLTPEAGATAHWTGDSLTIRPQGWGLVLAVAAALQGAFWAYDGWNKITYVAGEVREPQRNIPRALVGGMLIVTALYLVMNVVYAYVLPIDTMAQSRLVAADVAEKCGTGGGRWIALAVMISTSGAANATILTTARVYYSMAHRGVFPQLFGRVHPRFHTPAASLVVQGIWSALLVFSGTFDTLTDTLIFVSWLFYATGAFGVFVLRRRMPDAPRPYRVPGYPWLPAAFVVFAVIYLGLTVYHDVATYRASLAAGKPALLNTAFGTALVLIGAPIYWYYRRKR